MATRFLDWTRTIWRLSGRISSLRYRRSSALFYSYETITLKLYFEIIKGGDFKRLIASGKASLHRCEEAWNRIVQKNYESNGGYDYINYKDLLQAYGFLMVEYNIVKSCLLKLITLNLEAGIVLLGTDQPFVSDDGIIEELMDQGYRIDTSSPERYAETLNAALRRVDSLEIRIRLKHEEVQSLLKEGNGEEVTFDGIMAFLYSCFPNVPEDLTLSRYNEMMKVLKNRNRRKQTMSETD